MFFLKLMRKLGKLVRGGVAPRQLVLGAVLGVLIGMMPGFNLSVVLAVLALLILNAHVGIALMGFAVGKVFMVLLAPITFRIGFALIHSIGLEGVFGWLANTPVVALLELHTYSFIGGIPVAVVIGLAFAWLMVRVVGALRKGIVEATERSEKMRKLAGNKIVRLFMRIVFGKQKEDIEALLQKNPPLFRKAGIGLAAGVLVIMIVAELLLLDVLFAAGVKKGLEVANGAEVNIASADLSLASGKVDLQGLQMTDPRNPAYNSVEIKQLTADMDISDLLRKRYVVDLLSVRSVVFDKKRKSPGAVFEKRPAERPEKEKKTPMDYLEKAETIKKYLGKLQDYLEKQKARQKPKKKRKKQQKSRLVDAAKNRGYLDLSAKDLLAKHPTWLIRRIEVEGMKVPGLAAPQYLAGRNISSHPALVPESMSLMMAPRRDESPSAQVAFNFHDRERLHAVSLDLENLSLAKESVLADKAPVAVSSGNADVKLQGRFSSEKVDFPFKIGLAKLRAKGRGEKSVLGMDSETAQRVFRNVDSFTLVGAVRGSLAAPKVVLDTKKTLSSLKGAVAEAGKRELMKRVEGELGEAGGVFEGEIGKQLKKGVGGKLFGGDKDKKKDNENTESSDQGQKKNEEDSAVDKLKKFF